MREHKAYSVLVIDDDSVAIAALERGLAEKLSLKIEGKYNTAEAGILGIFQKRPDLLFLDVELPDMQGIELLNTIKADVNWDMHVAFYSAYSKYILSAMRSSAFDFLLKPFEQTELDGIVERFFNKQEEANISNALTLADSDLRKNNFIAATVTGFRIIRLDEIGFFSHIGLRKQWQANLINDEKLNLRRGTSANDILNYSPSFVQISQSTIININYLAAISGNQCKLLPPFDKVKDISISRNYMKKLQEMLHII